MKAVAKKSQRRDSSPYIFGAAVALTLLLFAYSGRHRVGNMDTLVEKGNFDALMAEERRKANADLERVKKEFKKINDETREKFERLVNEDVADNFGSIMDSFDKDLKSMNSRVSRLEGRKTDPVPNKQPDAARSDD